MVTYAKLTEEEVSFRIECSPEEIGIEGNYMASGDDAADKAVEDDILRQLEEGNEWAWCCVRVVAEWEGMEGHDFLGCCSF